MTNFLPLVAAFALTGASASAQVLGDFYASSFGQTPATAQAYINDGIAVPSMTGVSAFNLSGNGQLTSVVSNDGKLTVSVTAGSADQYQEDQYTQPPTNTRTDPLYQAGALTCSTVTYTVSGLLADGLAANSTYNLYIEGSNYTDVDGDFTVSYAYGSQSGGPSDPTGGNGFGSQEFTFTTGATALDTIDLTITKATSDSVPYPAITSFAIVQEVPEPSAWALALLGGAARVRARRRREHVS